MLLQERWRPVDGQFVRALNALQEFRNAEVSRDLRRRNLVLSRAKQARGHVAKLGRESLSRRQKQVRANEWDGRRAQGPRHHSSGRYGNVNVAPRELLEDKCRESQETLLELGRVSAVDSQGRTIWKAATGSRSPASTRPSSPMAAGSTPRWWRNRSPRSIAHIGSPPLPMHAARP